MEKLTREHLKKMLPAAQSRTISDSVLDQFNAMLSDPDAGEYFRENLLTYRSMLTEGRYKLSTYLSAVKYVSHKLMNKGNSEAYFLTFPEKLKDWDARGVPQTHRDSYVHAWHHSQLVTKILTQSIIPTWVVNQDLFQEALNTQAKLMRSEGVSPMVKHLAAKALIEHLKRPEAAKIELEVSSKENEFTQSLKNSIDELVKQQRERIIDGLSTATEVAEQAIFIGEAGSDE